MKKFSLTEKVQEAVFIIAEIGNNHNGKKETAIDLIDIAAESGADAVKFQTYKGLDIVTPQVLANEYPGWDVKGFEYWYEFIDSIALPFQDHKEVFEYAKKRGIIPFSTPTSPAIVDFLETLEVPLYKIASMDITNIQLLRKIASTGKPVILSTGMADDSEIDIAVSILKNNELAILHCVSDYPTQPENVNLNSITFIQEKYNVITGLSDHSITNEFALGAVALGGKVIEKHITYSRKAIEKAEHHFALEPEELKSMVCGIRCLEKGLGQKALVRSDQESENKSNYRRSLHLNKYMGEGTIIREEDISVLRPNTGDKPSEYDFYIGKRITKNIVPWTPLTQDLVE